VRAGGICSTYKNIVRTVRSALTEDSGTRCTQMGGKMAQDAGSRYMHIVLTGSGSAALGYPHARRQRHWAPVYLSQEETSLEFVACASGAYGYH